jgi:non-ribosomal peptide synthetase component F
MAFAALFQIILYYCTLEDDICLGTLTSIRNRRETETLIGNFSNNLLLRSRLSKNLSFYDLLAQVRETSLEANKHQDVPFQYLLNSVKDLPRFQVLLILRNSTTAQSFNVPGLEVSDIPVDLGLTRMDLSLDLTDDGKNPIFGKLEYKTDFFQEQMIGKMIQNFEALLESIITQPNQTLAEIKLPVIIGRPHLRDHEMVLRFQLQQKVVFNRILVVNLQLRAQILRKKLPLFGQKFSMFRRLEYMTTFLSWAVIL